MSATATAKKKKVNVPFDYSKYLRNDKLPHILCPGCGHGIALKSLLRGIDKLGLDKNDVAMVSGIGCSSRIPGYVDFNTLHTLHGRALSYATGIKLAKPHMKVLVATGDGDAMAIGGNHFIQTCRRNIDMTIFVFTNYTYGMTGGQFSPATPIGAISHTSHYGNIEPPFDACTLAKGAGATFVARGTAYHTAELEKITCEAIKHNGTSVIEIIDACPIYFGRDNSYKSISQMMEEIEKKGTVSIKQVDKLPPEKLEGKVVRGILHQEEKQEYCEGYEKLVAKAQGK